MSPELYVALAKSTVETIYMVGLSSAIATLVGLPLGVLLFVTGKGQVLPKPALYRWLSLLVNGMRSIPFIILLVALIPITRFIVGTSIGTNAAIVSLSVAAIPFVARLIENALQEVLPGLIEAGFAMGATRLQIITKILLPEAKSGIINSITVTVVTLVGYSAMAGAVGGGGLGDLAIRYGYERFDTTVMLLTIIILIVLVQLTQWLGDSLAKIK